MKKFLSILLAVLMLAVMLPVTALAAGPSGSIQGAIINHAAVSVELQDVTFTKSVAVKLYSGDTLLTTATLKPDILNVGQNYPFVTCCIPTEGEDEAWALTRWTPRDNVVPDKAVLVVDGHELGGTKTFTLDADEWAALPGTVLPCSIESAIITRENKILKNAVSVELQDVTFKTSVQVQLYRDNTLLTTATLNTVKQEAGSYQYLTCCIATQTADEYWPLTPWTPKDDVVPNRAVLVVDGSKLAEKVFTLNAEDWANLPGTYGGSIVIVPDRTEDTPKTDDQKNPSTGANDVVAAAVALMAVSALGMAVLTRKK